ncbi:MAG: hypothetical protein V4507_03745 [Verrucomicrobiota bacterium]
MNIDFTNFTEIQNQLNQEFPQKINQIGDLIFNESWAVAKALAPLVMAAELTFIGFRVIFKASIVEQMTVFTRKFFICYLLVYTNLVTGLFVGSDSVLEGLKNAGSTLGSEIIKIAPQAPTSPEPIIYWGNWMKETQGIGKNKFDFEYQRQTLFENDESIPTHLSTTPPGGTTPSGNGTTRGALHAEDYFFLITLPMIAIGNVIATAGMQISAALAPLFTGIGILHGSGLALRLVLALGICVVPLLFFHQFEKIFISYLHLLVGIALIPSLFYILSSIGFVLATETYDIVVEKLHLAHKLYGLFQEVADQTINQMIHFSADGNEYTALKQTLIEMLHYFGAYLCGSLVVTSFVIGGVALSAASVSLALRWNQAFADEGVVRAFAGFFSRIEGSFAQGLSQGMGSGMQGMSSLFGRSNNTQGK